jgi:hypothetical protein
LKLDPSQKLTLGEILPMEGREKIHRYYPNLNFLKNKNNKK